MTQVKEVFAEHRPNQTKGCRNRPPYEAFPELPRLPPIAEMVDPDHWLLSYQHRVFKRRINTSGRIQIDKHRYYVRRELAGRYVICQLDTHCRVFEMRLGGKVIKTMPIKGLYNEPLEFGLYLELMLKEAAAERRRLEHRHRRWLAR